MAGVPVAGFVEFDADETIIRHQNLNSLGLPDSMALPTLEVLVEAIVSSASQNVGKFNVKSTSLSASLLKAYRSPPGKSSDVLLQQGQWIRLRTEQSGSHTVIHHQDRSHIKEGQRLKRIELMGTRRSLPLKASVKETPCGLLPFLPAVSAQRTRRLSDCLSPCSPCNPPSSEENSPCGDLPSPSISTPISSRERNLSLAETPTGALDAFCSSDLLQFQAQQAWMAAASRAPCLSAGSETLSKDVLAEALESQSGLDKYDVKQILDSCCEYAVLESTFTQAFLEHFNSQVLRTR